MPMTIDDIAEAVAGRVVPAASGTHDGGVALHVVSDSRQIRSCSVFVAIKGERVDGHDFVQGAGAAGALVAIVDHVMPDADVAQIVVDDTVERSAGLPKPISFGVGPRANRSPSWQSPVRWAKPPPRICSNNCSAN